MPPTHHPTRLFRLSCGCLREYPMMPVGTRHTVLCVTCRAAAVTLHAYPDRCCGARGWVTVQARVQAFCTLETGLCAAGPHFDSYLGAEFTAVITALARSTEGRTGRA